MLSSTLVLAFLQALCVYGAPAGRDNAWSESQALYSTLIRAELEEEFYEDPSGHRLGRDVEEVLDETILLNHIIHGTNLRPYTPVDPEKCRLERRGWNNYQGKQERSMLEVLADTAVFGYYINAEALARIPQGVSGPTPAEIPNIVTNAFSYTGIFRELGRHTARTIRGVRTGAIGQADMENLAPAVGAAILHLDNSVNRRRRGLICGSATYQEHLHMLHVVEDTRREFGVLHALLSSPSSSPPPPPSNP